jgi:hypoxanthine phosphoribosyltransferase
MNNVRQLNWNEVEREVQAIVQKINDSGFKPDLICPIPRGGWTVAALIAQHFGIKETLSVDIIRENEQKNILANNSGRAKNKKILLIEDSLETGMTLNKAKIEILKSSPAELKTLAIFINESCKFKPDYFNHIVSDVPDFPWDQ